MNNLIRCWLVALLLGTASNVLSQGTAFPYQGRLIDNGQNANGNYDLTFALFNAEQGGAQQGGSLTLPSVPVVAGQFRVALDFGPGIFTGGGRWLEIAVRQSGVVDPPIVLSPRQALLPTPYAIHAGTAGGVADGIVTEVKLAPNAVVKSLNGLRDAVTLTAGPNVTITPNGNTLTIAAAGGGGGGGAGPWAVSGGNAFYEGNVGIGTATPNHRLRISGGPAWTGHAWGGALELDNASAIAWNANASGNHFGIGQTTDGLFIFSTASNPGTSGIPPNYHLVIGNSGQVGIGTPWGQSPSSKLTVYEPNSGYGIEHSNGTIGLGTYINSDGGWFGTSSNHKLHFFVNSGRSSLIGPSAAKAGIGPAIIINPPIDPPIVVQPPIEPPVGLQRSPSMTIDAVGNVGIGTASPETKLNVVGSGLTEARIRAFGERAILSLHGFNRTWTLESGVNGQAGLFAIYDRGSGRARLTIDTAGVVAVDVLQINGGADLSENFDVRDAKAEDSVEPPEIEPGTVVCIDPDDVGKLAISQQAYDRRVAGIISGACGIKPGMVMGQTGSLADGKHPVALTGRVYVKADATFGAIQPGDLLTTAATPGHAMRVSDHTQAQGAILGKAMSVLSEGQGMVLVLVTLQ